MFTPRHYSQHAILITSPDLAQRCRALDYERSMTTLPYDCFDKAHHSYGTRQRECGKPKSRYVEDDLLICALQVCFAAAAVAIQNQDAIPSQGYIRGIVCLVNERSKCSDGTSS